MPTSTFFRLPEEKRRRLLDATWEEITRVSLADASINQIIHGAAISRGSFYQYFTDKDDLMAYLVHQMQDYFSHRMKDVLTQVEGDLFRMPLLAFDQFINRDGITDSVLARLIRVVQLNPGVDFHRTVCSDRPERLQPEMLARIDTRNYRRSEEDFVNDVFFLCVSPLAFAIMESLREPEHRARQRDILAQRLEIVRWGALRPDA